MEQHEIDERITRNPGIYLGKPIFRGTRIPVYIVTEYLDLGLTPEEIVDDYPDLSIRDVEAAIAFAERERSRTEVRQLFQPG